MTPVSLAAPRGAAHTRAVAAYVSAMDTVFPCRAGVMARCLLPALRLPGARPADAEPAPEAVAA
ncbi:hypothetical protein [Streptomyces sp. NPDC007905]|uniref:hypothetical protein n=1 Tax=Streptomyces sp. NPDC007905 TaxID=3364788 RepID=UPI0036ED598C